LLLATVLALGARGGVAALGDMVFGRANGGGDAETFPPSVFSHWSHRIQYRCYVCHPAIFEMKQGTNAVTMEKINQGEFCGACHNGRAAFNVGFDSCLQCHRTLEE
jgi:c(7)-type cytochrome triheme protein